MNFRDWFLNEELLKYMDSKKWNELRHDYVKVRVPVYRNPSPDEFERLQHACGPRPWVGGLLTQEGDVYVWPRDVKTHNQMIENLDLPEPESPNEPLHFYVYSSGELGSYGKTWADWEDSPNILRMLGKDEPEEDESKEKQLALFPTHAHV
jgi:hypothetical protein